MWSDALAESSIEDVEKIAQKMKLSLESTVRALTLFVDSLEKSGFGTSIPAYRQMQYVLLQQRLWADRNSRKELQPLWESLSQQSDKLYQLMEPFAEIMNELRSIDKIKVQPTRSQDEFKEIERKIESLEAGLAEIRHSISIIKKAFKNEIVRYEKSQVKKRKHVQSILDSRELH